MNKDDIFQFIQSSPECHDCRERPTMHLAFEGFHLSGCDRHMIEIGDLLNHANYYSKKYINYDFKGRGDKSN